MTASERIANFLARLADRIDPIANLERIEFVTLPADLNDLHDGSDNPAEWGVDCE